MNRLLIISLGIVLLLCLSTEAREWSDVAPGDTAMLPRDLYARKGYRIQWWYFTGHLYDGNGREFGYELTFFRAGVQKRKYESKFGVNTVYLVHFAVSDIQGKKYYRFSNADSGAYGFAGAESSRLRVWVDKDSVEGDLGRMHVRAQAKDADLDLLLLPKKPFVLNGDHGYSRKSEDSPLIASIYFSCTDLETRGTVKLGANLFPVRGKSWFDRELSSLGLSKNEAGWDWFALQLDDGREIMLYTIRKKDGSTDPYSSGTLVDRRGGSRHLAKEDYKIDVISSYISKRTGVRYPAKWEITIPSENLKLLVTPSLDDQEFTWDQMTGKPYWEGTCRIEGNAQGRAYVELTGYE